MTKRGELNEKSIETALNEDKSELEIEEEMTLTHWAVKILKTADPKEKCNLTHLVAEKWANGELEMIGNCQPPDMPERQDSLNFLEPNKIKRGKGGTLVSNLTKI